MNKPLNPRQLKFVERYLLTGNATQSYIDAGYRSNRKAAEAAAARLLGDVRVQRVVQESRDKAAKANDVNAEWCIRRVQEEATFFGEGASHSARVRALELIGRMFGLFPNNLEHSGPKGRPIQVNLSKVSDADLDTLDAIIGAAEEPADEVAVDPA